MKTALFALFLLTVITSKLPSTKADVVIDSDGDPVRNGGVYFILPALGGKGGGLSLTSTGNETCPLTVVQIRDESSFGLQLVIQAIVKPTFITTNQLLMIRFLATPACSPYPPYWTIVEEQPEGWAVKIAGYEHIVAGWFKIHKYASDYKLVFCPSSGETCKDIGIFIDDDGNWRLVVSDNPLIVVFKKGLSSASI